MPTHKHTEGLAYFMIAALPPIVGLHTATIGPFFFALLGTSRNILSVGPTALACIYLPTSLQALGFDTSLKDDESQFLRADAASVLAFWVGIVFLLMSFFRLGGLMNFLSHSVMNGFTSAAGLYIGIAQLKYIFEIHPPQFHYHFQTFWWLLTHVHEAKPITTVLGLSALSFLLTVKILKRKFPATPARMHDWRYRAWKFFSTFSTLTVVVVTSLVAYFLEQHDKGVPVVGDVDAGLSAAKVPHYETAHLPLSTVIAESLPLAMLAFMESYSVGRKFADASGVKLDQNQDLFALGVGNVVSSFFSTFVAAGSFGRTALAGDTGARSSMTNVVMPLFVILALLFLTPLLAWIPLAVLGAVIESAVMNLIDVAEMRRGLRVAFLSGCVMVFTFLCTLLLSIETGLVYGVMCSVLMLLYQLSSVTLTELGLEEEFGLRLVSLEEHSEARQCVPGVAVIRPVTSLFFGNAVSFRARFARVCRGKHVSDNDDVEDDENTAGTVADGDVETGGVRKRGLGEVHTVLIDGSAIRVLDLTALGVLAEVVDEAEGKGVTVLISNTSHALKKSLQACGLYEKLGGELLTQSTEEVYAKYVLAMEETGTDHPLREDILCQELEEDTTMFKRLTKNYSVAAPKVT